MSPVSPAPSATVPGQLYRLLVRVPPEHVAEVRRHHGPEGQKALLRDVRARVAGNDQARRFDTLYATQDPTHPDIFTVIARRTPRPWAETGDPILRITGVEPVEEPPADPGPSEYAIDPGANPSEAAMWNSAMLHDTDVRHLDGIASTFGRWFPGAATLAHVKARLIEEKIRMNTPRVRELLNAARSIPLPPELSRAADAFDAWAHNQHLNGEPVPLSILRDDARLAAFEIATNPNRPLTGVQRPVENLAKLLVHRVPFEGRPWPIVPPHALAAAFPLREDDGFVSPSAMQLVLAAQKPAWSGVQRAARVAEAMATVMQQMLPKGATRLDALRAQHQIARASSALDRQRWMRYFQKRSEHQVTVF